MHFNSLTSKSKRKTSTALSVNTSFVPGRFVWWVLTRLVACPVFYLPSRSLGIFVIWKRDKRPPGRIITKKNGRREGFTHYNTIKDFRHWSSLVGFMQAVAFVNFFAHITTLLELLVLCIVISTTVMYPLIKTFFYKC